MLQPTSVPAQIVADTIVRTVELGVRITGAAVAGQTTVVFADLIVEGPARCPECGVVGTYRDTIERCSPTSRWSGIPLRAPLPYRAIGVSTTAATARSSPTTAAGWPVPGRRRPGAARPSCCGASRSTRPPSRLARELGRSWDTVNTIAIEATTALLLAAGPARLDGVRVIGVDEHRWAHVRSAEADGFVTVITDLTPVVAGHGPARLLDLVPGRSAAAMAGWLAARDQGFRDRVEIVAMDGFGGYKHAATEALPDAVTVMDPYPRVALVGHKLDLCRQRVQQDTLAPRPRRRPALPRPTHPAHPARAPDPPAAHPPGDGVRVRRARRGRGHVVDLPAGHRRLRRPRSPARQNAADHRDRSAPNRCRPGSRNWPPSAARCTGAAATCWPTSPTTPPTSHRGDTAASRRYGAEPRAGSDGVAARHHPRPDDPLEGHVEPPRARRESIGPREPDPEPGR